MKDKIFFIKIELSFGYLLCAQKFILGDLFSKSNKVADVKGGAYCNDELQFSFSSTQTMDLKSTHQD